MTHVMLVGNPNCGKTTLFNALTGDNQRIGNWPGVTVEKKTGLWSVDNQSINVTDLPGVYSLGITDNLAQDAKITSHSVAFGDADILINVVDACHLERHLYLTTQLLELNKPVIIALNMIDIAQSQGITIDIEALSEQLNCPVVAMQAHRQLGVTTLLQTINLLNIFESKDNPYQKKLPISFPEIVKTELTQLEHYLKKNQLCAIELISFVARRLLENGDKNASLLCLDGACLRAINIDISMSDSDILMADTRYNLIHKITLSVQKKTSDSSEHFTAKLDRIVLHRFGALPIFLGMMYLMFLLAINVGGAFQDFFDITTDTVFVKGTAWLLQKMQAPNWLIVLGANGVGKGINTTATFIPVMAVMFFFLSLLEASGYMARAAFVVDKIMRFLGLPGKSLIPMIVGFGCNVPGVMAARALDSERDRILTVLMSPFMSCSARLTIYTVFVAAFFPKGGQNIVFSLYLIGIGMAILTGFLLRKTLFQGEASPLILELPMYHRPSLQRLLKETLFRLRHFLMRAGKLIIPICILLGVLNAWTINTGFEQLSILAFIGQRMTPLFAPMGIQPDNWPAVVGLLTGTLAKEVVIGSLNSLYSQLGDVKQYIEITDFHFFASIKTALQSIPHNLSSLGDAFINPIVASAGNETMSQSAYGLMYQYFNGKAAAYAYLLFILLYIPCVSTMAAIRQETQTKYMLFSIIWSLVIAYSMAVLFYQVATYKDHMLGTLEWMITIIMTILLVVICMYFFTKRGRHVIATA
ncbi:MAG: Fe(2+) transporter permease subunit FeoB [Legionellaceae bacterium]|nr:Fe(2+) transporter permease subunit FeoB [Legionellaceae bacterium]